MALVVFLKGVNVGGHRRFRPSVLAKQLQRFDVVSVGAAGTFVVRGKVSRATLRAEIVRRLPFAADVTIRDAREILSVAGRDPFAAEPSGPALLHFVSVLARRPRAPSTMPLHIPAGDDWCVRVLALDNRFAFGVCRRQMRAIGCLGQLEKTWKVPVTTRSWTTIAAIARILKSE